MRTSSNPGTFTSSFSVSEKHAGPSNEAILPPPAVHFSTPNARRLKRTRIKESARGLRMCFDRVRRRFGSGSAPSASSVDLEADSVEDEGAMWEHFSGRRRKLEESDEIDEVVVDREWGEDLGSTAHSDHGEQSRASHPGVTATSGTETASVDGLPDDGVHASTNPFVVFFRWRIWPSVKSFFYTSFLDGKSEEQYRRESWFLRKVSLFAGVIDAPLTPPSEFGSLVRCFLYPQLAAFRVLHSETSQPRGQDISLWCRSISPLPDAVLTRRSLHPLSRSQSSSWFCLIFPATDHGYIKSCSRSQPGCGASTK